MTDKPELKPCPFCGGEATVRTANPSDERTGYNFASTCQCNTCNASITVTSESDKNGWCVSERDYVEANAITAWNTRATISNEAQAKRIAELEAKVQELTMFKLQALGQEYDQAKKDNQKETS